MLKPHIIVTMIASICSGVPTPIHSTIYTHQIEKSLVSRHLQCFLPMGTLSMHENMQRSDWFEAAADLTYPRTSNREEHWKFVDNCSI